MDTDMAVTDHVKKLAIGLQRHKTYIECNGLQELYWDSYWKLSEAIWSLENNARIDAPGLRDREDGLDPAE